MSFSTIILLIFSTACSTKVISGVTKPLSDTIIISKPVTDEISGSAYRKRATQYQVAKGADTSRFSIIVSESNNNEFDRDGSVHLEIHFDKNKTYSEQKTELNMLVGKASREYNFDSLRSIYSLWLPSLGDLDIKISKELENSTNINLLQDSYGELCEFLLTSSLAKELNELFKKYNLTVKQFAIEHFGYYPVKSLLQYSKIETNPADFPKKIMSGAVWIYFEFKRQT